MAAPSRLPHLRLPLLLLAFALVVGAWWGSRTPAGVEPVARPVLRSAATEHAGTLTEEAIRLYAAGQFARACERFSRAADDAPSSAARRQDVGRCFEGWGWESLRDGRAEEAMLLFRQALTQTPEAPALLKGFGLAAVHAGRAEEALGPLETSARLEEDVEVRLLLAHLYDHRDEPQRALAHLRAALERAPRHPGAARLLEKVERERTAESGFTRELTPHFVLKYGAGSDAEARRVLAAALEAARERVTAHLGDAGSERVTVILYERPQFQAVTGVHGWVTGLFDGKIRLPLGGPLPAPRQLERLLVHEYAHAAVHHLSRGRAPRWLHEGLAQALEGAAPDPLLRVPGHPTLGGIEALLGDPDPARARAGYDLALWVVRDLLDRGGMPAARELLVRLGRGDAIAAAVPAVYGLRLSELESQWRRVLGG